MPRTSHLPRLLALGLALAIPLQTISLQALADPPPGKGPNAHHGGERHGPPDRNSGRDSPSVNIQFHDSDRIAVRNYYADIGHSGHCPPGLAKKNERCMPPGQARKWAVGRPLPRDVVFYDLPPDLVMRMSPPPAGYRYVRVASDILMIAAGTGMVAAAIQDLAYGY